MSRVGVSKLKYLALAISFLIQFYWSYRILKGPDSQKIVQLLFCISCLVINLSIVKKCVFPKWVKTIIIICSILIVLNIIAYLTISFIFSGSGFDDWLD